MTTGFTDIVFSFDWAADGGADSEASDTLFAGFRVGHTGLITELARFPLGGPEPLRTSETLSAFPLGSVRLSPARRRADENSMRAGAARRRPCVRVPVAALALACVVGAGSAAAEGRLSTPDEAYAARGLPRLVFDGRDARIDAAEARFLEALFALTDEAVVENANLLRWFGSDGRAGLHFLDARERLAAIRARIAALEPPARLGPVRALVLEALDHQRSFFADHYDAVQAGRSFESQLTDEFAWHDAPQRARQALLRAYAELRGLYPEADTATRAALNAHLRALDLGP